MKKFAQQFKLTAAIALVMLAQTSPVAACSVCYGEPDSPMSQGLTWAITSLAVIVFGVLAGVTAFFVQASRRALPMNQNSATTKGDRQ